MATGERIGTTNGEGGLLRSGSLHVSKFPGKVVMILTFLVCLTGCIQPKAHEAHPLTNPDALNAIVWAKKATGTYYCRDSAVFGKDQGSSMKQARALDTGYQPEFGVYCTSRGRQTQHDSSLPKVQAR